MPAHRKLLLDDYQLLDELSHGKTVAQIAREHGVSAQATRWRIQALKRNLPAPAARRAEETLEETLSAVGELNRNAEILNDLRDACLRLLEDETGRLEVGPHDYDLEVVVSLGGRPPVRRPLKELLGTQGEDLLLSLESKHADPRQLLLSVITQIRQHIELAVRLTERIHDAQELARFQHEILACIEEADAETAARIRSRLHERRQLRLALAPPRTE